MKAETTTVKLPRTLLETGADKDIELECTLADYLPGINRVIRTEANLLPEEVIINGNKAELYGKAVFSLLYESDYKGKLKSEKFVTDFNQRFDIGELPDGEHFPIAHCRCSYVGCKTLNPRRFILRCRADTRIEIKSMQGAKTVSAEDCKGAFFKTANHEVSYVMPPCRKDFSIHENISLEGMTPVAEIIYAAVCFTPGELSLSDGCATVRCNGVFKCLYEEESDEGNIKLLERSFPASFSIDDPDISSDTKANADIVCTGCEAMKEQDNYGENRIISLNCNALVKLSYLNKTNIKAATDMFFEEYECKARRDALYCEEAEMLPRHRFTVEKAVEIPDLPFTSCIDSNCEIVIKEVAVEDGNIEVKGVCAMNVLGCDEDGFSTHDVNLSFTETVPLQLKGVDAKAKISANAINASADVNNGRFNLRIAAELCGFIYKKKSFEALAEAEVTKLEAEAEDCKPIVIYYPEKGETAWDIGKRYHVDPKSILAANGDAFGKNEEIVNSGTVLYMQA